MGIRFEVIDASQYLIASWIIWLESSVGAEARFVEDGDTIILDTGKATAHLAAALHGRKGLTVITNSLACCRNWRRSRVSALSEWRNRAGHESCLDRQERRRGI